MNPEDLIGKTITGVATELNADDKPDTLRLSFDDGTTVEFWASPWAGSDGATLVISTVRA